MIIKTSTPEPLEKMHLQKDGFLKRQPLKKIKMLMMKSSTK